VALWCLSGMAQAFLVPVVSFTTQLTPNDQRGRVMGLVGAGFMGLTAIGFLVAGAIASITSPAFAVVVMASVALVIVAVAYLVWPADTLRAEVRRLDAG